MIKPILCSSYNVISCVYFVQKSISKGMRYLNKCSFDRSDELCKTEVQGEALQVLQPLFKTLHTLKTLPGWSKGNQFFSRAACQFRETSTVHFSLYYTDWSSKVRAKKLLFGFLWWSKLARLIPALLLIPLFKIATEEVNAKCHCLSLKSRTCKKHKNIFHHTAQQICLCFNSLMKQKKAKTKDEHDFFLLLCLLLINQTLRRSHSINSGYVFHQGF